MWGTTQTWATRLGGQVVAAATRQTLDSGND